MQRRLILASASPRRNELLSLLGLPFEVIPSIVSERIDPEMSPEELARILATEKAGEVATREWSRRFPETGKWDADIIVIGCDTIVAIDAPESAILGKPTDSSDAARMLRLLSGRVHTVFTGVSIVSRKWHEEWSSAQAVVDTQVQFRSLTPEMIDWYIATGEPFDKAGAYGIQGHASMFVEAVYGDYFNVVGLPIQTVARLLEGIGIEWWRGTAALQ